MLPNGSRHARFTVLIPVMALLIGAAEAAPARQAPRPAEERTSTLVGEDDRLGWMVAPSLGFAEIRSNSGLLVGAKGGAILNHRLVLGAAGYLYVQNAFGGTSGGNADFGYGGAYLEYIFAPRSLFHFSLSTVLGGGTANNNFVMVANPALNAIMNLSETVHLGAELAYRAVSTVANNRPNSDQFSGPSFSIFLQFGNF